VLQYIYINDILLKKFGAFKYGVLSFCQFQLCSRLPLHFNVNNIFFFVFIIVTCLILMQQFFNVYKKIVFLEYTRQHLEKVSNL